MRNKDYYSPSSDINSFPGTWPRTGGERRLLGYDGPDGRRRGRRDGSLQEDDAPHDQPRDDDEEPAVDREDHGGNQRAPDDQDDARGEGGARAPAGMSRPGGRS